MLDADIYGPSQPTMLGIAGRPESTDGKTLEPMEAYGVQAMSIGFLIDVDTPMVWRGPMVTQALEQLLKDTRWRDLDYLIVDMPPGTGDIQLTLVAEGAGHRRGHRDHAAGHRAHRRAQGAQDVREGRRADRRHRREHEHPRLQQLRSRRAHLRRGRCAKMCRDYNVPFLGSLPLDIRIREQADSGRPTVVADPDGKVAQIYREIARKTAVAVAQKARTSRAKFPSIVIQNT